MKRALRIAIAVVSLVLAALALGALLPRPFIAEDRGSAPRTHRILVLTNPIHTDIAIPVDAAVRERFAFLGSAGMPIDAPGVRYLVFGWGGREFYTETPIWSELKLRPLLKGLTIDRSVMHVDLSGEIVEPKAAVTGFDLSDESFDRLNRFIRAGFSGEGTPQPIENAFYGEFDAFYPAEGSFTALMGCNTWTAKALREAGLQTGWWNPLPASLAVSLRLHNGQDVGR